MSERIVTEIILDRIDKLDSELDEKMTFLTGEIIDCKLDIQSVQKDLKNHLDNKKAEIENSKRKMYFITAFLGVAFTAYATIKELV